MMPSTVVLVMVFFLSSSLLRPHLSYWMFGPLQQKEGIQGQIQDMFHMNDGLSARAVFSPMQPGSVENFML